MERKERDEHERQRQNAIQKPQKTRNTWVDMTQSEQMTLIEREARMKTKCKQIESKRNDMKTRLKRNGTNGTDVMQHYREDEVARFSI